MAILLSVLTYLFSTSNTANKLVPTSLSAGVSGAIAAFFTKRLVLLLILIGMTMFGSHRKEAEDALNTYVYTGLGINLTNSPPPLVLDQNPVEPAKTADPMNW